MEELLRRLRPMFAGFPGVEEGTTVHHPSFKVRKTAFVMCIEARRGEVLSLWCKSTMDEQRELVLSDPQRFFVPPYVGPRGWVGVRLVEPLDWTEVAEIVEDAYRTVASKRQLAELDERAAR